MEEIAQYLVEEVEVAQHGATCLLHHQAAVQVSAIRLVHLQAHVILTGTPPTPAVSSMFLTLYLH